MPTPSSTPTRHRESWRARRNRRLAAFVCLPGLTLGTASLVGAHAAGLFTPRLERVCEVAAPVLPSVSSFDVRVYNASGVEGLARRTAVTLKAQGFRVVAVGNAPDSQWFDGAAKVVHGPRGEMQAALVRSRIPGAGASSDLRVDSSVDILLGSAALVPRTVAPMAVPSSGSSCG